MLNFERSFLGFESTLDGFDLSIKPLVFPKSSCSNSNSPKPLRTLRKPWERSFAINSVKFLPSNTPEDFIRMSLRSFFKSQTTNTLGLLLLHEMMGSDERSSTILALFVSWIGWEFQTLHPRVVIGCSNQMLFICDSGNFGSCFWKLYLDTVMFFLYFCIL